MWVKYTQREGEAVRYNKKVRVDQCVKRWWWSWPWGK